MSAQTAKQRLSYVSRRSRERRRAQLERMYARAYAREQDRQDYIEEIVNCSNKELISTLARIDVMRCVILRALEQRIL